MDDLEQLCQSVRWRSKRKYNRSERLSDTLSKLVDNHISPQQARFAAVSEFWNGFLPAELRRHCKIDDIQGSQLKVNIKSPSYANELRWCKSELLERMQRECPQAKIKDIKLVIG